jgi:hypothetical protein
MVKHGELIIQDNLKDLLLFILIFHNVLTCMQHIQMYINLFTEMEGCIKLNDVQLHPWMLVCIDLHPWMIQHSLGSVANSRVPI